MPEPTPKPAAPADAKPAESKPAEQKQETSIFGAIANALFNPKNFQARILQHPGK